MILKQIVKNKSFGSALLKSCNLKIYKDLRFQIIGKWMRILKLTILKVKLQILLNV
jgi:hypothetical protein